MIYFSTSFSHQISNHTCISTDKYYLQIELGENIKLALIILGISLTLIYAVKLITTFYMDNKKENNNRRERHNNYLLAIKRLEKQKS